MRQTNSRENLCGTNHTFRKAGYKELVHSVSHGPQTTHIRIWIQIFFFFTNVLSIQSQRATQCSGYGVVLYEFKQRHDMMFMSLCRKDNGDPRLEEVKIERLLSTELSSILKWYSYIQSFHKDVGEMVSSLLPSSKCGTAILHKTRSDRNIEYCYHICAGGMLRSFACGDRGQNHLRELEGDEQFLAVQFLFPQTKHRKNLAILLCVWISLPHFPFPVKIPDI